MKNEHVISGLVEKRRDLVSRIDQAQMALRQYMIDLDALDATIRLFAPDLNLEKIKAKAPPVKHAAGKGEIVAAILGTLRESQAPVSTYDLTLHVMAQRGMNTTDKKLVAMMRKRVGSALRHHRRAGLVRSSKGPDKFNAWEVAR